MIKKRPRRKREQESGVGEKQNNRLLSLISFGEGQKTEFKKLVESSQKISRVLCAFANTSGGMLFVGVNDDGRIIGVESEKYTRYILLEAIDRYIVPKIPFKETIFPFRGRDVFILHIAESSIKPHEVMLPEKKSRKIYLRKGSSNLEASAEESYLLRSSKL